MKYIIAVLALLVFIPVSAQTPGKLTSFSLEERKTQAEIEKTEAEKAKFIAERNSLEKSDWGKPSTWLPTAAILFTVGFGYLQLRIQRKMQVERAEVDSKMQLERAQVDACLKAAEISMNAPTTGHLRARATIMEALLRDYVPNFAAKLSQLDFSKIGFASYRIRFEKLLEVIAGDPAQAMFLVDIYDQLFPDDDGNSHGRIKSLREKLKSNAIALAEPGQSS